MPRVIHFEIPADEPDRAVAFYQNVFGWTIKKEGPIEYWLATTGPDDKPGINGAIMRRAERTTTCNTIDVPSVDEFVKKIQNAGGKAVTSKAVIPGVGYFAYCADTEGNVFAIMQEDPNAR
jgi:predicted enzyme related to lactoylglutathione lyase